MRELSPQSSEGKPNIPQLNWVDPDTIWFGLPNQLERTPLVFGLISAALINVEDGTLITLDYWNKTEYLDNVTLGKIRQKSHSSRDSKDSRIRVWSIQGDIIPGCENDSLLVPVKLNGPSRPGYKSPDLSDLNWDKFDNLEIDVLGTSIYDEITGKYLMTGYINRQSYLETIESGRLVLYSRTRKTLWPKGQTSGNPLDVVRMTATNTFRNRPLPWDRRNDVRFYVNAIGPVCHTGNMSCFDKEPFVDTPESLAKLMSVSKGISGSQLAYVSERIRNFYTFAIRGQSNNSDISPKE